MLADLDPIERLIALRRLREAETLAREHLGLPVDPYIDPLGIARATRQLADVLLEALHPEKAAPFVQRARVRYRPFFDDPGLLAEIHLTVASHAFMSGRSFEAETALHTALRATAERKEHRLLCARAVRLEAHFEILGGELVTGVKLLEAAIALLGTDDDAGALQRLQYSLSLAEANVVLEDRARVEEALAIARDVIEAKLSADGELAAFGRSRADQIATVSMAPLMARTGP